MIFVSVPMSANEKWVRQLVLAIAAIAVISLFSLLSQMNNQMIRITTEVEMLHQQNERIIGVILEVHPLSNRGKDEEK